MQHMVENIQNWLAQNPEISNLITMVGVIFIIIFSYIISYRLLARGLIYLAERTQSKYDDIIIQHIKPRRMALAVPVLVIYIYAYLIPDLYEFVQNSMLFVLMWLGIITLNGFLDALNDIFDHLLAVVPDFELRVFQEPSGRDFESLVRSI